MNFTFPTTRWTVVRKLAFSEREGHAPAWEEFVEDYRSPLITWLRTRCGDEDAAEELVQAFFVKLFSKSSSFTRVDSANGKMRTWLLNALRNHWVDEIRKSRLPTKQLPENLAVEADQSEEREFDVEWARSLAGRALNGLQDEYKSRANGDLFLALLETMDDEKPDSHRKRAEAFGMTANGFAVALMRFRGRVANRLWQEVAITVDGSSEQVDGELRHLVGVLARTGGLNSALEPWGNT